MSVFDWRGPSPEIELTDLDRPRADNTSGFKGVSYFTSRKKWAAQIWYDGGNHFLGFFDTAEQACERYVKAAAARKESAPVFDFSCFFVQAGDRDRKAINGAD